MKRLRNIILSNDFFQMRKFVQNVLLNLRRFFLCFGFFVQNVIDKMLWKEQARRDVNKESD